MGNEVNERRWLAVIFMLYFLLAVGYSLLMPVWETPDEPAHYHVAWHLATKDALPTETHNYEVVQPHAYYYLAALVLRGLEAIDPQYTEYFLPTEIKTNIRVNERRFDWNDGNYRFMPGVHVLRWLNILLGALALWLGWRVFGLIVPETPPLRVAALALAGLTPQYIHIMASVSNDALGTVAGALLFYLAVRVVKEQNNILAMLSVILALILPLVSKLTVLPVSAAVLVFIGGKWLFGLRRKGWLIIAGLVVVSSFAILYFFFPEAAGWTQKEITWRLFSFRPGGLTAEYLSLISNQILETYWGKVGWIAAGLPDWVIYGLTLLGSVGMAIRAYRLATFKTTHPQPGSWAATFLIASFAILAVARNGLTTGATQGRFLFPAIGALSFLMISGWHDVLPEKFQRNLPLLVTILMVVLNLVLWVFGIIPVYYQPFLD